MNQTADLVDRLVNKYNTPVPRYTSYPTALDWNSDYPESEFFHALESLEQDRPVSLYMHIPFCEDRCLFCGCNVLVSRKREMATPFLENLLQEMRYKASFLKERHPVVQIHAGGGTPNYLPAEEWFKITDAIRENFDVDENCEWSIELDPMVLSEEYLEVLKRAGFNRVSFGIQDVNPKVLEEVHRPQTLEHLAKIIAKVRELEFSSMNFDFIYGLPYQTPENFQNNLDFVAEHKPDRIAMYSYAHVPWMKRHQKRMNSDAIPDGESKLRLYMQAREAFSKVGYTEIGMDHFAFEGDGLVQAQQEGRLYRNFMGYTTFKDVDLLAFGPSSISFFNGHFAQNHPKLKAWNTSVEEKKEWFEKGYALTREDKIRSRVIQELMNNFVMNFDELDREFGIDSRQTFSSEIKALEPFEEEGFLALSEERIVVYETGKFVIRHIAKVFDAFRNQSVDRGFSKGL